MLSSVPYGEQAGISREMLSGVLLSAESLTAEPYGMSLALTQHMTVDAKMNGASKMNEKTKACECETCRPDMRGACVDCGQATDKGRKLCVDCALRIILGSCEGDK